MLQTTLIPDSTTFSITIPKSFVGKTVHAILYTDEEVNKEIGTTTQLKASDYFGTLPPDEAEKMHKYLQKARNEWKEAI